MSNVKPYRSLKHFLRENSCKKGEEFTHTSMTGGIFYITEEQFHKFFKLYSNEVNKNEELSLTEKHLD